MHAINQNRRQFIGSAALTLAAVPLGILPSAAASPKKETAMEAASIPDTIHRSFGPLKQIDAGELNIGYAEDGPANGPVVILLHGWPYDIRSFADVAPLLAHRSGISTMLPLISALFLSTIPIMSALSSTITAGDSG